MGEQMNLPGVAPAVSDDLAGLPDAIQQDLKVVLGQMPEVGENPLDEKELTGEKLDSKKTATDARDYFMKRTDRKNERDVRTEHRIQSFDLSDQKEADEYAKLCNEAGDPKNKIELQVTSALQVVDPNAPRGFRVLITTKMFKVVHQIEVIPTPFSEVTATGVHKDAVSPKPPTEPESQG